MTSPTPPPPPPPTPPPPPPPAGDAGGAGGGGTDLGLDANLAGLLCYAPCCVGLVVSAVSAVVEKKSRFVRFHAFQSLLLHGAALALMLVFYILAAVAAAIMAPLALLVMLVNWLVGLALLVLMIVLMVRAYNNEELELPYIGPMARGWV